MNIVFLDEYSISNTPLTEIKSLGNYTGYEYTATRDEAVERCKDADVVITNKVLMNSDTIAALPNLKLICVAATGMNNIDLEAARNAGVEVRNAVGYSTHSVAEATLGATLTLLRQSQYYDQHFKSGAYSHSPRLFVFDRSIHTLHSKNWGIIGLGNIGREVARLASAFGCEVAYSSTSGVVREESFEQKSLDELLAWADVISVHSPLNDSTRGLLGDKEFAMMRQNAILINVARGGIVDEDALVRALDSNTIAAAALDVFENEPIRPDSNLLRLNDPNQLLASPHNAWAAEESIAQLVAAIAQNIREVML